MPLHPLSFPPLARHAVDIVFCSLRTTDGDVYVDGADILPVFSNDGKYLMWTSKRSADKTTQIFVARFKPPVDW
jgi:hypothetical protein